MFFKGAKVLIIGGTGTIGENLIKQILLEEPEVIRVFSRDEYKQYLLQNQLDKQKNLRYLIGDVRDFDRVFSAMNDIDFVFHLAAMKHVPACEYNPYEAVLTNIHGTQNVIKAAIAQKVKKVIFTSSDKAISPTNIYGATKLAAERLISAAEYSKGKGITILTSVRFGNVIGSRGSVIPYFINQIVEERKVTVTDQFMTRFMMTVNDATQLTIQALKEAKGGEIFVLKMPVILLKDLVSVVIEETCKKYCIDVENIKIEDIGLRPGEKRHEELMTYEESMDGWELENMYILAPGFGKLHNYNGAEKAKAGTYSSHNQKPLSLEEVRTLLKKEILLL